MAASDRRAFGTTEKLPSGRYRALYRHNGAKHTAAVTFDDKDTAIMWLQRERRLIEDNPLTWTPPRERARQAQQDRKRRGLTFGEYANAWLANRRVKGRPLADRTRAHYRRLLDDHILPTFADVLLSDIEPEDVDNWHAVTLPHAPTLRAHSYSLLRTILGTAADRRLIPSNAAKIVGAGNVERARKIEPATLEELEAITKAMPERLQLMILLAAWTALRFGELTELRRFDVLTKKGVLRVRRGVVRANGRRIVKDPKSRAGSRDVAIPPHLMPAVRDHLLKYAEPGAEGLLFPAKAGGHLAPSTLYGRATVTDKKGKMTVRGHGFYEARRLAGRPDLAFHDLRHTGATMAAQEGATLAELMRRLGHSTPQAALRYQHSSDTRDAELARRLSDRANGGSK
jgi:integrase